MKNFGSHWRLNESHSFDDSILCNSSEFNPASLVRLIMYAVLIRKSRENRVVRRIIIKTSFFFRASYEIFVSFILLVLIKMIGSLVFSNTSNGLGALDTITIQDQYSKYRLVKE